MSIVSGGSAAPDRRLAAPDRRLVALGVGTVAAGVVLALRASPLLVGGAALIWAALILVALPTARTLSARIFLAGSIVLTWVPCLWWLPPTGPVAWRATALLALGTGLAVGLAAIRPRSLLPRVRLVDAVPLAVFGGLVVAYLPLLRIRSAPDGLAFMLGAWDNVGHFNMVRQILAYGATADAVGLLEGGVQPASIGYPQAFHATVSTLMELRSPDKVQHLDNQIPLFLQSSTLVVILTATVLVAGLCALPALRRRATWAAALGVTAIGGLMAGPGHDALLDAFYNFVYACALVAVAAIAAVTPRAIGRPLAVAAAVGAVVSVAHSWVLFAPLAAVALLPLVDLTAFRRARPGLRAVSLAILAVGVAATLRGLLLVVGVVATDPLTLGGGISPASFGSTLFVMAAVVALSLLALATRPGESARRMLVGVLLVSGTALLLLAVVIAYQLFRVDMVDYYALKLWTGIMMTGLAVLPLPVTVLLRRAPLTRTLSVAGAVVALAASQAHGYLGPALGSRPQPDMAPGVSAFAHLPELTSLRFEHFRQPAQRIVSVALLQQDHPDRFYFFVAAPPDGLRNGFLTNTWIRTLTLTWYHHTGGDVLKPLPDMVTGEDLPQAVRAVLDHDPPVTPVVMEQDLAHARAGLPAHEALRVEALPLRPTDHLAEVVGGVVGAQPRP